MKLFTVRFYIGATLANGFLDIAEDSLDDAEGKVVEMLKQPSVNVVFGPEDPGRHAYFCPAITGYSITQAVVPSLGDGD